MSGNSWLGRIAGRAGHAPKSAPLAPVVRAAPGLAALFETLDPGRTHAVLDFGAAAESSLATYSLLARQVRFADLSATPSAATEWPAALEQAQSASGDPFDALLVWDTLGRVSAEDRALLISRLAELSAPGARLHMVLEAPEHSGPRPVRFSLVDRGHMRHELTWDDASSVARLLPLHVERMLAPFQVERAFTLKDGLREYVAVRRAPTKAEMLARAAAGNREQLPGTQLHAGIPTGYRITRTASPLGTRAGTAFANGANQIPNSPETIQ